MRALAAGLGPLAAQGGDLRSARMTTLPATALLDHLRARQGEMVELLRRLVLLETPSLVPESQGPAFDLLAEALAGAGYRVRHLPGRKSGGQLLALPNARQRGRGAQLLLGHVDTVWERGTLEWMPVALTDGRLTGPGVFDMKGGLVQGIFALLALAALGLEPPVPPIFLINSDEEVGSEESTRAIERLARRVHRVFVLEPALGPEGKLKTARKGIGRFIVTVHGRAAHAGLDPEKGASAIVEMAHVILRLQALSDPARGVTVNVGVVAGGTRANVVAPEARAEIDVRVLSMADGKEIERAILGLAPVTPGTRIEVEGAVDRAPLERTPRNRVLYERAVAAARELGIELGEATAGGASDGNTTSAYAATLDGLGPVGDGAHAVHEFVSVDRLPERAALLALLLLSPT
jgi:glutamate carboxypeptidase